MGTYPECQGETNGPTKHARVPDGVVARRRDGGGETTEEGERIHVDGDGPVGVGPLQEDADEAVWTVLDLVLRNGRPEHVPEQRLAA
jgi:hypothetical protein